MSDRGYSVASAWDGSVLQSGVATPGMDDDIATSALGMMTRAVVIRVYPADDGSWAGRAWSDGANRGVAADVRTYGSRSSRNLYHVPVLQLRHGLQDEEVWIPRPSRIAIAGGMLVTEASTSGPRPTPAEGLDGDHVLVGFLENDPAQPVVLPFTMGHPASKRKIVGSEGHVWRRRFNGVLVEVDRNGNYVVDATGAAKEELGPGGSEISNSGTGGKVTIKTKNGVGGEASIEIDSSGNIAINAAPLSKVTVDSLAEVCGATDAQVRGTNFYLAFNTFIGAISTALGKALSTPPIDPSWLVFIQDFTAAITALGVSQGAAPWLSVKAKVG